MKLVRWQELDEVLEREYPMEVNDPIRPLADILLQGYIGMALIENGTLVSCRVFCRIGTKLFQLIEWVLVNGLWSKTIVQGLLDEVLNDAFVILREFDSIFDVG